MSNNFNPSPFDYGQNYSYSPPQPTPPPPRDNKLAIILGATFASILLIAFIVIGFLVFRGGDDDPDPQAAPQANSTSTDIGAAAPRPSISDKSTTAPDGVGDPSATLIPTSEKPIFRNSENFEYLEHPNNISPGVKYSVYDDSGTNIGTCSFGWNVVDTRNDDRLLNLTAGHCGNKGDRVYIETAEGDLVEVGEFIWSEPPNPDQDLTEASDWALIEFTISPDYVDNFIPEENDEAYGDGPTEAVVDQIGSIEELEQTKPRICRLGYRSGFSCGNYVEALNDYTFTYTTISDHGDSGGIIWAVDPNNASHGSAVGVTSYLQLKDGTLAGGKTIDEVMDDFDLALWNGLVSR